MKKTVSIVVILVRMLFIYKECGGVFGRADPAPTEDGNTAQSDCRRKYCRL